MNGVAVVPERARLNDAKRDLPSAVGGGWLKSQISCSFGSFSHSFVPLCGEATMVTTFVVNDNQEDETTDTTKQHSSFTS